ncbi:pyridoxal phosphate-dependent transferase [Lactarius sanguifluus]|nr:pyridoxal phosphate-dependent transferase [Lactarius sanguifluus]
MFTWTRDIADFLCTGPSILYSQNTLRDLCGLQISRSTIRWFDHNDLKSLEDRNVLLTVEKERRGPLTRRFIITEGIFEEDGAMVDLPKHVIELKHKYKYRLTLDESISFGTVGRTGRDLTELYNIPATRIDMIVGSVANGSTHGAGFCTGSRIVADHQCINDTSFVFSAAAPALLTVFCFGGDQHLAEHAVDPEYANGTLQENVRMIRAVLDQVEAITIAIPSHAASPIIHIHLRSSAPAASVSAKPSNPATPAPREPPSFDIELVEAQPSMRLAVMAGLSRKENERAAGVIKAAIAMVLAKRK